MDLIEDILELYDMAETDPRVFYFSFRIFNIEEGK